MISQIKITFWYLIPLILIFNGMLPHWESRPNEIEHIISIKHPGEKHSIQATLTELQNEDGLPISYYMDVESVICLAEVCKVIPVTLYWNDIGEFQNYKLQSGATLEKYEADLFEPNDYKKLQTILENLNSPFKDVFIEDILTVPNTLNEEIDALSGATILELDEKDTVPGAALTCYTLWHWANGQIVSEIKNITGANLTSKQLLTYLNSTLENYQIFALNEITKRKEIKPDYIDILKKIVPNSSKKINKHVVKYIEFSRPEMYSELIGQLYSKVNNENRLLYLNSLLRSKKHSTSENYDVYTENIGLLTSYQEIDLILQILEQINMTSYQVEQITALLNHKNFLIARRVYWFLLNQEQSPSLQIKIKEFHTQNKEKL